MDGRKRCINASVDEKLFIRFQETENGGWVIDLLGVIIPLVLLFKDPVSLFTLITKGPHQIFPDESLKYSNIKKVIQL